MMTSITTARLPFFSADYLAWFRQFRFDPSQVNIRCDSNGQLAVRISGPWVEVILWEVPLLALISELVHHHESPQVTPEDAVIRLRELVARFYQDAEQAGLDLSRFKLMDFGTRRRFSFDVQKAIVTELKQHFPYLVGTSNYLLAENSIWSRSAPVRMNGSVHISRSVRNWPTASAPLSKPGLMNIRISSVSH